MSRLMAVLGDRGSGKTLFVVRMLLKSIQPFYSNFKVYQDKTRGKLNKRYNELHPEELLYLDDERKKVAITEAYEYMESRLGMGAFQRYMSYIVFQTRKRKMDFIIDTQLDDTIDHRFMRLCDYIVVAESDINGFNYYITNKKIINIVSISFKQAEKFWDLYDSWEVILTPQLEELGVKIGTQNKKKLNEKLRELENQFYNTYGQLENKKITHAVVDNFLLEREESDIYSPYLYARLQKPKL